MSHSKSFFSRHPAVVPVLLGLAIVIVSALALVYAIGSRDALPPADGDLALERLEIPDEANAYTAFIAAAEAYAPPTPANLLSDYLEGRPVDTNALKAFVAVNHETYALMQPAANRAHCIFPCFQDFFAETPGFRKLRLLARLLLVKGSLALGESDYAGAKEAIAALIRFGGLVQEHPESYVQHMMGIWMLEEGLTIAMKLAQDPDAPTEALRTVAEALAQTPSITNGFIWAMKAEYRLGTLVIDAVATGTVPPDLQFNPYDPFGGSEGGLLRVGGSPLPRYLIHPNRTKRLYAEHIRDFIENAPRSYANMTLTSSPTPSRLNRVLRNVRPNNIGYLMLEFMSPCLDTYRQRLCVSRSNLAAARLVVALHLHRREHGAFPDRLDALVPDELEAVPLDPFDGRPFRYDAKRRIVYSVGKNLVDDGGSSLRLKGSASDPESRRRWNAEDAVYRIEAASGK